MDGRPLAGRTFRSASGSPAAALAAFLLSDLGARVLDVAPGAPADLADRHGTSAAGGVALSPYGPRGRFADGPDHHSAVEAVGGAHLAQYTYAPGPAYLVTPYSTVAQAALAAAAAVAGAIGGTGPPPAISALQGLCALQAGFYSFGREREPHRFDHSPRGQTPVYSTYRCADDWIFLGASTTPFMIKVLQAVGLDDVLGDPRIHAEGARALRGSDLGRELWERIDPVMRRHPRDHWLGVFARLGVPAGPVLTLEEALTHPQITTAGLAEPGEPVGHLTRLASVTRHGGFASLTTSDSRPRTPQTPGPLPLSALRVVELAGYIAGSYVGRLLADLGADVVKIEPPDGDPFRVTGYGFAAWNHGKKGLALNLRDPGDRSRLAGIVREADILVTNYRPEALARMAVGREDLFAVNPGLIHCTVSAFGETGPLAHLPGFDPVVQAFAGIMKRQGGPDEPAKPQMAAADYLAGMLGALGVLAARAAQLTHGGGYVVRTSLLAAALLLNHGAYADLRAGRPYLAGGRDYKGPHPLNSLHRTRDSWLLTAALGAAPGEFGAALRYLAHDVGEDALDAARVRLHQWGIPAVPCIDPWDLPAEPHFADNNLWLQIEEPELGPLTLPAPVLGPTRDTAPPPQLGEHNGLTDVWSALQPTAR